MRVWAGQHSDWSSGGLSTRKNAVWWDCRLERREGGGNGTGGGKQITLTFLHGGETWNVVCKRIHFVGFLSLYHLQKKQASEFGFAVSLLFLHMRQAYLWANSACWTITTLSGCRISIGHSSSQSQCREWVTRKPQHTSCPYLILYLPELRPASHYLSNTIYNWGTLCPESSSSQGVLLYSAALRQRQGAMAVANFQYITRMSSGFKVYILEGKLNYNSSFSPSCWIITVNTNNNNNNTFIYRHALTLYCNGCILCYSFI